MSGLSIASLSLGSGTSWQQNAELSVGPNMTSLSLGSGSIWQQNAEMSGGNLSSINIAGTWIRDVTQTFSHGNAILTVANGGLITHNVNPAVSTRQRGIDLAVKDLIVQSGGNIDVAGSGYRGSRDGHDGRNGLGPGGGLNGGSGGGYGGAGASYNGLYGLVSGGVSYGSVDQPVDLGSGGGFSPDWTMVGGRGGGAIKIIANRDIDISGNILANGASNPDTSYYFPAGSGGSIWLSAGGQMSGAGIIRSNGGNSFAGGGGGGGRIALYYGNSTFTGTVTANGGFWSAAPSLVGGAGTIWQQNR